MRRQPPVRRAAAWSGSLRDWRVGENAPRETAQDLSFYERGGFGCTIHGESVLLGTASFLRKQDVRLPSNIISENRHFSGHPIHQLAAVFAVKYEASRKWWITRCGPAPAAGSRRFWRCGTPTFTPALLKRKFYKKIKVEYPQSDGPGGPQRSGGGPGLPRALLHAGRVCCPMPKRWWAAAVCGRRCAGQPGCPWRAAPPAFCLTAYLVSLGKFDLPHPLVPDGVFAAVDPAGAADERLDRPIIDT